MINSFYAGGLVDGRVVQDAWGEKICYNEVSSSVKILVSEPTDFKRYFSLLIVGEDSTMK